MSDQKHIWEAGLRPKVEQHEFEYDPTAWAAMEQLLDGGLLLGAPTDTTEGTTPKTAALLRWSIILLGAALVFMLVRDTPASNTSENTNNTPTEELDSQQFELTPEMPLQIPAGLEPNIERRYGAAPINQTRKAVPLAPLPLPRREVERLPERQGAYTTRLLPRSVLIPLPDALGHKDELPELVPSNRKRNRRTLFPDVLESPVRKRDRKTLFPDIINQY